MNIALPVNQYLFKLLKCMIADTLKNDPFATISTEERIGIHEFLADKPKKISEDYVKKVFNEGMKARRDFKEHTLDALVFFVSNQKNTLYKYENWVDFINKEGNNEITKKLAKNPYNFATLPLTLQKEIDNAVWQRLRPKEEKPFALPTQITPQPTGYTIVLNKITQAFSYHSTVALSFVFAFFTSIADTFGKSVFFGSKIATIVTSSVIIIGGSLIVNKYATSDTNRVTIIVDYFGKELMEDSIGFHIQESIYTKKYRKERKQLLLDQKQLETERNTQKNNLSKANEWQFLRTAEEKKKRISEIKIEIRKIEEKIRLNKIKLYKIWELLETDSINSQYQVIEEDIIKLEIEYNIQKSNLAKASEWQFLRTAEERKKQILEIRIDMEKIEEEIKFKKNQLNEWDNLIR